jgi:hypothetical protein
LFENNYFKLMDREMWLTAISTTHIIVPLIAGKRANACSLHVTMAWQS